MSSYAFSTRAFNIKKVPKPENQFYDFSLPDGLVDIEIGCGVGLHPVDYAIKHPDRSLIAIEHTREKYEKFVCRIQDHGHLENLYPMHANAISWISHLVPPNSVSRYFLLYPNPYPKSRDIGKRWYAMPFMQQLLKTLKVGGTINLATNCSFYIEEASDYFRQCWGLRLSSMRELGYDDLEQARTHFERKYLERKEKCFDLVLIKD
ncbi:MAG: SAM-dependent methyltransferase [Oligoflexales bacterium]|nr:SAM-dependent methyltransferase [Oligoflexales bacterium]